MGTPFAVCACSRLASAAMTFRIGPNELENRLLFAVPKKGRLNIQCMEFLKLVGITGQDMISEKGQEDSTIEELQLGFGSCRLCVQAPVHAKLTDVRTLIGKRIVTS